MEIKEFNTKCAEFLGCNVNQNVSDWTEFNSKSLTEHWNNNDRIYTKISKGSGQPWYKVKHRDKFYQLFTDFTFQEIPLTSIEYGFDYNNRYCSLNNAKFHSDWSLIMDVCQKIEDLNYSITVTNIGMNSYLCYIASGGTDVSRSKILPTKKEAVIMAITNFLISYNS